MTGSGRLALWMSGVVWIFSWMSGSSREALPNVEEWSGVPYGCPGVVWSFSWKSESSREALPDVQEWSGDPAKCPGVVGGHPSCPGVRLGYLRVVGRLSRMSISGRKALSEVWEVSTKFREWSGDPPGCP